MYRKLASKGVLMNALAAPIVAIIVLAATPAQAQTYENSQYASRPTAGTATTSLVAILLWPSADCQLQAEQPNA